MKKIIVILLVVTSSLFTTKAQSLSQVVVANTGATISGASNTLSFTAGESVTGNVLNDVSLGQGFWLGAVEAIVLSNDDFNLDVATTVYPNPVTDYLTIHYNDIDASEITVSLYDLQGRQLLSKEYDASVETRLDFTPFSTGTFLLTIQLKNTKKLKSFKIIKQ